LFIRDWVGALARKLLEELAAGEAGRASYEYRTRSRRHVSGERRSWRR
jgi:hypothetical protein